MAFDVRIFTFTYELEAKNELEAKRLAIERFMKMNFVPGKHKLPWLKDCEVVWRGEM